jgi:hypothetical protein
MLTYTFLSNTEVFVTNNDDINIIQDRYPESGELFTSREETQAWLDNYSKQINQTIYDNLEFIKSQKKKEISDACELAINTDAFQSSAQSSIMKTYSSSANDQFNIQSLVITAISDTTQKLYWNAVGEELSEWTADEILKLWEDLKISRESHLTKCDNIKNYIDQQDNEDIITNITWSTGIQEV